MNITITTSTEDHKRLLKNRLKGLTKSGLIEVIMGEQNSRMTMTHAAYILMNQDQFPADMVDLYMDYVAGVAEDIGITENGVYAL